MDFIPGANTAYLKVLLLLVSNIRIPKNSTLKLLRLCFTFCKFPVFKIIHKFLLQFQVEDMSASEKWPGFVLTKEGEEFVQTNTHYLTYDLCYNPLRYESWLKLAKILDEVQQFSVCLMHLYKILAI